MITFLNEETQESKVPRWINVSSENSDIVLFELGVGGPLDPTVPENHAHYTSYAIYGGQLLNIHDFAENGTKADWMGADSEVVMFPSGLRRCIWLDFEEHNGNIVIWSGNYAPESTREQGDLFSYEIPKEQFQTFAKELLALYVEISPFRDKHHS